MVVSEAPLKNMKVSWNDYSQYMEHIKLMFQIIQPENHLWIMGYAGKQTDNCGLFYENICKHDIDKCLLQWENHPSMGVWMHTVRIFHVPFLYPKVYWRKNMDRFPNTPVTREKHRGSWGIKSSISSPCDNNLPATVQNTLGFVMAVSIFRHTP